MKYPLQHALVKKINERLKRLVRRLLDNKVTLSIVVLSISYAMLNAGNLVFVHGIKSHDNRLIRLGLTLGGNVNCHVYERDGFIELEDLVLDNLRIDHPHEDSLPTALEYSCTHGDVSSVTLLLRNGADIKGLDRFGQPVIFYSLQRLDIVRKILSSGADMNKLSPLLGTSPLMEACANVNPTLVSLLISAGCNVNAISADNNSTPLNCAVTSQSNGSLDPERVKIVALLLNAGANPDSPNSYPPIISAIICNQPNCLKLLLEHGASIDKPYSNCTVLQFASIRGKSECVALIQQQMKKNLSKILRNVGRHAVLEGGTEKL